MATNDLFSALISDIKNYSGKDPLLPWLKGIRRLKDSLPSEIVNEKLPRFLQKCTLKFESDPRYRDDVRYLRVWLQLMDYVDDQRPLLRTMEEKSIGITRALFYQAYALYYEKVKKFDEADKMYHLGVQRLAEPVDELTKSYEQFLHRMKRRNQKRIKGDIESTCHEVRDADKSLSSMTIASNCDEAEQKEQYTSSFNVSAKGNMENKHESDTLLDEKLNNGADGRSHGAELFVESNKKGILKKPSKVRTLCDSSVTKSLDTSILRKPVGEDFCHHGLVEPTINLKEAMNVINGMFCEPLQPAPATQRSSKDRLKNLDARNGEFKVFIDENLETVRELAKQKEEEGFPLPQQRKAEVFKIYVDDEESESCGNIDDEKESFEHGDEQNLAEGSVSFSRDNAFVFPCPNDHPSENSGDSKVKDLTRTTRFREDTVVRRFVGSAITEEPKVENICHHGLVEPTVNLKEAMNDINNMFGKPMEFVRSRRSRKQEKQPESKMDFGGFSILPDDDLEQPDEPSIKATQKSTEEELFEPTMFTKEARDEINKLFGMSMD